MYQPFDKIVFRTPYYPIDVLFKALTDNNCFDQYIKSKTFKTAIFYASPDLYGELIKYINGELKDKDRVRIKNSLVKYLSRMSSRCTPFGMFASCAIGKLSDNTKIVVDSSTTIAHVRFDMLFLCNLSQNLIKIPEIRKNVKYFLNSTLYKRGNKLRYIEYQFNTHRRIYHLVEVFTNKYLNLIIKISQNGTYISDMASMLISFDNKLSSDMAISYIESLIDNQIIVSEIDPVITGDDFFTYLTSVLLNKMPELEICKKIYQIDKLLQQLNGKIRINFDETAICAEIESIIKSIPIPYSKRYLFQVDTTRNMSCSALDKKLIEQLQDCMRFLNKLSSVNEINNQKKFIDKFINRYEGQEIPLMEALDPELGIGYPIDQVNDINPLIVGLKLPEHTKSQNYQTTISTLEIILQKKIMNFKENFEKEIVLEEADLKGIPENWYDSPATLYAMVKLIKKNFEPNNSLLQLNGFYGASAGNLLARFAYSNQDIYRLLEDITLKEKNIYKDYIVAEISHIPDSRVGNVLARPNIRDYEIVYLANTTRPREEVIYPSDILVSVSNNRILLRSKRLKKYIIPRLTTAHNYQNNPTPVYKFLCELQSQKLTKNLFFSWGILNQQLNFLPRVRYKNIILCPARWKIAVKDIIYMTKQKDLVRLQENVRDWKLRLKLPRYVYLVDSDNTLFVDMNSLTSINAFLSTIAERKQIILEEFIFDGEHPFVSNAINESYTNECIIPFFKSSTSNK